MAITKRLQTGLSLGDDVVTSIWTNKIQELAL